MPPHFAPVGSPHCQYSTEARGAFVLLLLLNPWLISTIFKFGFNILSSVLKKSPSLAKDFQWMFWYSIRMKTRLLTVTLTTALFIKQCTRLWKLSQMHPTDIQFWLPTQQILMCCAIFHFFTSCQPTVKRQVNSSFCFTCLFATLMTLGKGKYRIHQLLVGFHWDSSMLKPDFSFDFQHGTMKKYT